MITRKDLVETLRVLHETDQITKIVTRAKRIDISYIGENRQNCLLVLPNQTPTNDKHDRNTETKRIPHHVQVSNDAMDATNKSVTP